MIKELFLQRDWHRDGELFDHRQVFTNGEIYIYEVGYKNSKNRWYEFFKRKIVPDIEKIDGKLVRSKENFHVKYPGDNDFGFWAFNLVDKEEFIKLFKDHHKRKIKTFVGCLNGLETWLTEANNLDAFVLKYFRWSTIPPDKK